MEITTKIGTIAQVFSVSIKNVMAFTTKKRATILVKTYVSVLFYRNTQTVNHVQSIHSIDFGLFILLHQLASSKLSYFAQTWLVLGWKYSPKSFYSRIWRVGER